MGYKSIEEQKQAARNTNELLDHLTRIIEQNDERFSFEMNNIGLKAWKLGLTLFNENDEPVMSVNEIRENEIYHYIVGKNMFKELKKYFLVFLKETNYKPTEVDFDQMATQIASHYAVCIENEPDETYIDSVTSFKSIKESAEWFWKIIVNKIEEYDVEI